MSEQNLLEQIKILKAELARWEQLQDHSVFRMLINQRDDARSEAEMWKADNDRLRSLLADAAAYVYRYGDSRKDRHIWRTFQAATKGMTLDDPYDDSQDEELETVG